MMKGWLMNGWLVRVRALSRHGGRGSDILLEQELSTLFDNGSPTNKVAAESFGYEVLIYLLADGSLQLSSIGYRSAQRGQG